MEGWSDGHEHEVLGSYAPAVPREHDGEAPFTVRLSFDVSAPTDTPAVSDGSVPADGAERADQATAPDKSRHLLR